MMVWLKHVPAGALADEDSRTASQFISRDTIVKRNTILVRANLAEVPIGADNMTIVVAAYRVGSDNGTQFVRNLTVSRQQIRFTPGFHISTVDLSQVNGDAKHVTMWLRNEDGETVATWQFKHRSAATTQDAPLSADASMGDLVMWAFAHIGLYILIGGVAGVLVGFALVKRAYTGPGNDGIGTLVLLSIPGVLVLAFVYFNLVELFVTTPALFALPSFGMLVVLTILASPGTDIDKGILIRPSVTEVESPSGADGVDWETSKEKVVKLVDADDGKARVEEGWLPFFARIYGGAAVIENWDEARALTPLHDSTHDWWHVLSPSSKDQYGDDLMGYERPTLTVAAPDSWKGIAWRLLVIAIAGLTGWQLYPGTSIALGVLTAGAVAVLVSLDGEDGSAHIPWGSKHHRRAYATASMLAEEMDAADSVDESEQKRMAEKATTERKAREKAAGYESAFVGEMLGTEPDFDDLVDAPGNGSDETATRERVMARVDAGDLSVEQALKLLDAGDNAAADGGEASGE